MNQPPVQRASRLPARVARRTAIYAAGASIAASTTLARGAHAATDVPDLRAVVNYGGKTFEYSARRGQNLGAFKSDIGNFVQGCYRVAREDIPLIVFFRPDQGASRVEVVFELGRVFSATPAHMEAYSVTLWDGAAELARVDVPKHFWFSRWRWQSEPRPVVGDVNALIAKGLLPPFEVAGSAPKPTDQAKPKPVSGLPGGGQIRLPGPAAPTAKGASLGLGGPAPGAGQTAKPVEMTYSIMGLAGVTPYMPMTGERPDIGLVTEPQARYICTGAADALALVRAQAEAAGTCPWHMRDDKSSAPIDLDAFPGMSWYGGGAKEINPRVVIPPCEVELDSAHMPALAYLPYLLTGDPYHLEDLQFAANWNRGSQPPSFRFLVTQTRAFAWNIRTLAQCVKVSPETVPGWLQPRSYWVRQLDTWRDHMMKRYAANPSPECSVFKALEDPRNTRDEPKAPGGTHIPVWQTEFSNAVVGWMVLMGFEDWKPFFVWQVGSTIARTNGRSGWRRAHATPYRLIIRPDSTSAFFTTWSQAWELTAKLWGWEQDDPDKIIDEDLTYYTYSRASLALAKRLAVPEADVCLDWLDGQLRARNHTINFKWRFA
jgi:hypothetical protein